MKFKVWDKKEKCWENPGKFFVGSDGSLFEVFGNSGGSCELEKSGSHLKPVYSTGKPDKNGIELFGGDIVDNVGNDPHLIKWDIRGFWACAAIKKNNSGYKGRALFHMDKEFPDIVKIGNKFENPQLLEKP